MGQVVISLGKAGAPSGMGAPIPVFHADGQIEELNSGPASTATTITAQKDDVAMVTNNSGGLIWAAFGANPVAVVGATHAIMDGDVRAFGPLAAGAKVAVINDS